MRTRNGNAFKIPRYLSVYYSYIFFQTISLLPPPTYEPPPRNPQSFQNVHPSSAARWSCWFFFSMIKRHVYMYLTWYVTPLFISILECLLKPLLTCFLLEMFFFLHSTYNTIQCIPILLVYWFLLANNELKKNFKIESNDNIRLKEKYSIQRKRYRCRLFFK